jgi:hypothetical protein
VQEPGSTLIYGCYVAFRHAWVALGFLLNPAATWCITGRCFASLGSAAPASRLVTCLSERPPDCSKERSGPGRGISVGHNPPTARRWIAHRIKP